MTTPVASSPAVSAPAAPAGASSTQSGELERLRGVAKQFEAVFLRQMIGSMRQASGGEGLFDNGGSEQFRDMSDARLADHMAEKGALHVADLLVKQYGARMGSAAK